MHDEAIERAMAAQIYAVVATAHLDACCTTYAVMESPKFLIQVGPTYSDGEEADMAAKRLNLKAAISAFLADTPVSEGMVGAGINALDACESTAWFDAEACQFKAMAAKLAEEIQ